MLLFRKDLEPQLKRHKIRHEFEPYNASGEPKIDVCKSNNTNEPRFPFSNTEATSRYAGGRFRGGNVNVGNRYRHDRDQEVHRREEHERQERHGRHERHGQQERDEHDRPDSRRGYTRLQFRGRFPRK